MTENKSPHFSIRNLVSKSQLERAAALLTAGAIKSINQTDDGYSAFYYDDTSFPHLVSIAISGEQIYGSCDCLSASPAEPLCDHAVALYIATSPDAKELVKVGDTRLILPAPEESLSEAREREITRRKERALSDIADVIPQKSRSDGSRPFTVTSLSGQRYEVILHSHNIAANDCNCPDLEINQLGTCKHIEAALSYNGGQEIELSRPLLYVEYERGLAELALLTQADIEPELDDLFDKNTHILKELTPDTWQTLNTFAGEGMLTISRTAALLLDSFKHECASNDKSAELLATLEKSGYKVPAFKGSLSQTEKQALTFALRHQAAWLTAPLDWGKSVVTLAAIAVLAAEKPTKALIVTIEPLLTDWRKKAAAFLNIPIYSGTESAGTTFLGEETFIRVITYEEALRNCEELSDFTADLLIVDEAQYINNWRSPTGRAITRLKATRRLLLTSCDLLADPDAVFSIMQIIDQKVLGPLWLFNQRFIAFDSDGKPTWRSEDAILSHLAAHWWRRPLLSERSAQDLQILSCYTQPEEQYFTQYKKTIAAINIPDSSGLFATDSSWHTLLDDVIRALYFGGKSNAAVAPKVALLIQLWRGLFSRTDRHYVVLAHSEQILHLATAGNNYLGSNCYILYSDLPPASRLAKLEAFHKAHEAAILFCTDYNLDDLHFNDAKLSFIFFDLPWHPLWLKQRLDKIAAYPALALIYQDTVEEKLLDFYAKNRSAFTALPKESKKIDNSLPISDKLEALMREILATLSASSPFSLQKRANNNTSAISSTRFRRTSLLFDFSSAPKEAGKDIPPPKAKSSKKKSPAKAPEIPSDTLTLDNLLALTANLASAWKLEGNYPELLLKNAYIQNLSDEKLLFLHELTAIFGLTCRGEPVPEALKRHFAGNRAKLNY